jgi:hypothetical protein
MPDHDPDVAALLERAAARPRSVSGSWQEILDDARAPRRPWLLAALPALGLAALAAAVVLAWPFGGGAGGSVLDRALAAVGNGPVLHIVLNEGWHGTLVDLRTGARSELHGEREAWYDPGRGVHEVARFDGIVQSDVLYPPDRVPPIYPGLLDGYRGALRSGNVDGEPGVVDGAPVLWIKVHRELLPDVSDGKLHEFAQELAVTPDTYQPVALRDTRDGVAGPDGATTIVKLESLPDGGGDFTRGSGGLDNGTAMRQDARDVSPQEAETAMSRPAVWLGTSFSGLDLSQLQQTTTRLGRTPLERVTAATVTRECRARAAKARDAAAATAACDRRAAQLRGRTIVTTAGPPVWGEPHTGVRVGYGAVSGGRGIRAEGAGYVTLEETTELYPGFGRGATGYVPPEGSIVVFGGGIGLLRAHGVDVHIEASSEDLLLAAARALRPVPSA